MTKTVSKAKAARAPKAKAVNPDHIATVLSARGSSTIVVNSNDGQSLTRPSAGDTKAFRSFAVVGQSFRALAKYCAANPVAKPTAKLARGIGVGDAPNCAKAVSDQKAAPKATTGKGKDRAVKAPKAKQPSKGTDRAYTKGTKKDESKPDTFRKYMLSTILSHKSTASAKAAHAASGQYPSHKLDFNWSAQQGYITLK